VASAACVSSVILSEAAARRKASINSTRRPAQVNSTRTFFERDTFGVAFAVVALDALVALAVLAGFVVLVKVDFLTAKFCSVSGLIHRRPFGGMRFWVAAGRHLDIGQV
jgi:hypothetical protein